MGGTQGETWAVKILLDTNVILDVALERQPLFSKSEEVLSLAENGAFEAFISASTFSDLYYVIRKQKGRSLAFNFVDSIAEVYQIASVDRAVISLALTLGFQDFEDGIQCATASVNQLDAIVTRNAEDYTQSPVQVFTPLALIQALEH
jgi:predicted nucleic acid-binding protein